MKQLFKPAALAAVTSLAAVSLPAMAETARTNLEVIGTITPASCAVSLGGNGIMDYGSINPNDVSADDYTLLGPKSAPFAITCDAPAKAAIRVISGRPGTTAGATEGVTGVALSPVPLFGLPANANGVVGLGLDGESKVGGYGVRIIPGQVLADDVAVDIIARNSPESPWLASTVGSVFNNAAHREVSWAPTSTLLPIAFTTLSAQLEVEAYLNKGSELDMSKPVPLKGLSTIELVYL